MPPPEASSLLAHLNLFSPLRVRLMAKTDAAHVPVALTNAEIAIAGGLTLRRVEQLSRMTDWDSVTFDEFNRFCTACRFNPLNAKDRQRLQDYENKCITRGARPFQWLRRSPAYETEFRPLIRLLSQEPSPTQHVA